MISDSYKPKQLSPAEYMNGRTNPLRPRVISNDTSGIYIVHYAMRGAGDAQGNAPVTFAMRGLVTILNLSRTGDDAWRLVSQPMNMLEVPVGDPLEDICPDSGIIVTKGGRAEKYFLAIPPSEEDILCADDETVYGIPPVVLAMA